MPTAINSITSNTLAEGPQRAPNAEIRSFEQSLARVASRSVEPRRTRLTPDQAAVAIREAMSRATGSEPNQQTVALLTAQWAHETAHGASMYNYNFGGIKGTGPTGLSVQQRTREGWGKAERSTTDQFRAYESAQDGANDYVKLLLQRYPEAISAAQRGDASGFVRGLKQRGYFTGDEHAYERSVASISSGLLNGDDSVRTAAGSRASMAQAIVTRQDSVSPITVQHYPATAPLTAGNVGSYVEPLMPTALAANISATSESPSASRETSMPDDFSAVSALSMADEVVRAALLEPRTANRESPYLRVSPAVG